MILVVGGTGHLGRSVVSALRTLGHPVRVMAKGAGSAHDLADRGAQLFPGDIRDRDRVVAALAGVTVCVSAAQGPEHPLELYRMKWAAEASLRGHTIDVGGPHELTFNDFARRLTGREPRHVPRLALRVMGAVAGPVKPQMARLARAALHMDTADMTFDTGPSLTAYPWLTSRPIGAAAP